MEKTNKSGVVLVEKALSVNGLSRVKCRCPNCGETFEMWASHFYRGSNSCKCNHDLKRNNKRIYSIWINMKTRCYNPKTPLFKNYGGRGIGVCDEWRSNFGAFCNWALANGYSASLSIDRINNDLGYFPENCRWATSKEQCDNRRNTLLFDCYGEKKTLKDICNICGLKYKIEHARLMKIGHDAEQRYLDEYLELEGEQHE